MNTILAKQHLADDTEMDLFVDAPYNLTQIKALGKKSDYSVKIKLVEISSSGSACVHSAACVILVPFLLLEASFDKNLYEVDVEKLGLPYFIGKFTASGQLIKARKFIDDKYIDIKLLHLPLLERKFLIKEYEGIHNNGIIINSTPVSLSSQVDLIHAYKEKLQVKKDPNYRQSLINEAIMWLGDKSESLVLNLLADPLEGPDIKKRILKTACHSKNTGNSAILSKKNVLNAIKDNLNYGLALASMDCFYNHSYDETGDAGIFIAAIANNYCSTVKTKLSITTLYNKIFQSKPLSVITNCVKRCDNYNTALNNKFINKSIKNCANPARKIRLKRVLQLPVSEQEMVNAFNLQNEDNDLLTLIYESDPIKYRRLYFTLINNNKFMANSALLQIANLKKPYSLSESEIKQLVKLYFEDDFVDSGFFSLAVDSDYEKRYRILSIFNNARKLNNTLKYAKHIFKEKLNSNSNVEKSNIEIGLAILGETDYVFKSLKTSNLKANDLLNYNIRYIKSEADVVTNGIILLGCDYRKIANLLQDNKSAKYYEKLICLSDIN